MILLKPIAIIVVYNLSSNSHKVSVHCRKGAVKVLQTLACTKAGLSAVTLYTATRVIIVKSREFEGFL